MKRVRKYPSAFWARINALYGAVSRRGSTASCRRRTIIGGQKPVVTRAKKAIATFVELNRAVAVSTAHGPEAGLVLVDALLSDRSLANYHLLPMVRGDLLFKLGRTAEARVEFERAASLARNARGRKLLLDRAAACVTAGSEPRP